MHLLLTLGLLDAIDPQKLLATFGALGLFAMVFAESGLLVGFFLPGDSLLFTAGLLSSQGKLWPLPLLLAGCFLAAAAGDQVGYAFGNRVGPALFKRPDSRFFHQRNVERSQEYFDEHGPKTILIARFVPVVRTFAPILAGVGKMRYRTFLAYNLVGALLWACGVTTLGFFLGKSIPNIDRYLLPAVLVIIVLSLLPVFLELRKQRNGARASSTDSLADTETEPTP